MSDDFDFGFTAMNENELETVKKLDFTNQVTTDINKKLEDKIDRLYNAIIPLLTNLKKNPEKFFTKEILDAINEGCKADFMYGKNDVQNDEIDVEDEVEDATGN